MPDDDVRAKVAKYIEHKLYWEKIWTKLWSFLHHGVLFGAAALSAAAALVLQLKTIIPFPEAGPSRSDVATGLAALASFLGVISVSGAFGEKWRANRATRSTLEELKLELMKTSADPDKIVDQLEAMWRLHNSRIADEPGRPVPGIPANDGLRAKASSAETSPGASSSRDET